MRNRWSVVASILSVSLIATLAAAQKPVPKPVGPVPAPAAKALPTLKLPPELGLKRAGAYNLALRRSGLPPLTIPPPPAFVRLTPAAPVSGGAKITEVGAAVYVGPRPEAPDGAFAVEAAPPPPRGPQIFPSSNPFSLLTVKGTVSLAFPAEGNTLYVVDCKASSPFVGSPPVSFFRPESDANQQVAPEDGHYLYAFRTRAGTRLDQTVHLRFEAASMFFYGCEITKGP